MKLFISPKKSLLPAFPIATFTSALTAPYGKYRKPLKPMFSLKESPQFLFLMIVREEIGGYFSSEDKNKSTTPVSVSFRVYRLLA